METRVLDTRGLRCPQPMLKLAVLSPEMREGELLKVLGDYPTFEHDIRTWCGRLGKTLLLVESEGEEKRITISF